MMRPAVPAAPKKDAPAVKKTAAAPSSVAPGVAKGKTHPPQEPEIEIIEDEAGEYARWKRRLRILHLQAVAIGIASVVMIVGVPFFQPIYHYFAVNPEQKVVQLVPLTLPNMTNQAILSWSTTSVTEVMTIGFGDFETKLITQKVRFTKDGWDAFVKAFLTAKIGDSFRKHQLVLTTVPSDVPVIVSQGENDDHIYEWKVQMPIIMTYATNNNVTRPEKAVIDLTIVRVPYEQSVSGVAIDSWRQGHP